MNYPDNFYQSGMDNHLDGPTDEQEEAAATAEILRDMANDFEAVLAKYAKKQDDIAAWCGVEDAICDLRVCADQIEKDARNV